MHRRREIKTTNIPTTFMLSSGPEAEQIVYYVCMSEPVDSPLSPLRIHQGRTEQELTCPLEATSEAQGGGSSEMASECYKKL